MFLEHMLTSFVVGITATSSPCVLPLYPGYLAYLATGSRREQGEKGGYFFGFLVLLGVLTSVLVLGSIVTFASLALGDVLVIAIPLANTVLILLGTLLLLDRNPFTRLAQTRVPVLSNPYSGSYAYGLLYGPIILPCSGSLAVSVFALSFSVSQFFEKISLFLVFGLGLGIPLLVLSLLAATRREWLAKQLALRHTLLNRIAGLILIGLGIWGLNTNLHLLSVYL